MKDGLPLATQKYSCLILPCRNALSRFLGSSRRDGRIKISQHFVQDWQKPAARFETLLLPLPLPLCLSLQTHCRPKIPIALYSARYPEDWLALVCRFCSVIQVVGGWGGRGHALLATFTYSLVDPKFPPRLTGLPISHISGGWILVYIGWCALLYRGGTV